MAEYRVREAAGLLGVSDDTLRRWIEAGRLTSHVAAGIQMVDGAELAALAQTIADTQPGVQPDGQSSARNRFTGLVTRVVRDTVMAQVEIQAGPHRLVSLMSRESADSLGLEPGMLATASIKATMVVVEGHGQLH